jgi:hypothetical protein
MKMPPIEILREGRSLLDPVMHRHGFSFKDGPAGRSSGGHYASGVYVNGNRRLEIHFRYSLGLVTYHFGRTSLDHESYMHALLGTNGGNKYPGFSEDPLDAFRGLAYDLENFATAFLNGNSEEYSRCVIAAEERKKIPGFARLP